MNRAVPKVGGEARKDIRNAVVTHGQATDPFWSVVKIITHDVHHAYPVGNHSTILNRGRSYGTFEKSEVSREEVVTMMAGGEERGRLTAELEDFEYSDREAARGSAGDGSRSDDPSREETRHQEDRETT